MIKIVDKQKFNSLEKKLIDLVTDKDQDNLRDKISYYQEILSPIIIELTQQSPFPSPSSQLAPLTGIWLPIWTTIPFVDMIPGRIPLQSYQIFDSNGYYANIARYLPVKSFKWLSWLFSPAYDLMIVQKFMVENEQWIIENVAIKQAVYRRNIFPLSTEKAREWFNGVVRDEISLKDREENEFIPEAEKNKLNRKWYKKLKTTAQAKPFFEHLYMSENLRIVKTYREANQRPSYTIAIRYLS